MGAAALLSKQWPEIKEIDDSTTIDKILNIWQRNKPKILLSGAGAYNLLEQTVRLAAKEVNIPCVAVLDYWANYQERFRRREGKEWVYSIPDRICVLDEIVKNEMLAERFSPETIVATGQPYFEYISNWINTLSPKDINLFRNRFMKDEKTLLIGFCSEPIAEDLEMMHNDEIGYTQYTILSNVAPLLKRLAESRSIGIHLVVRPHPREENRNLKEILAQMQSSSTFTWEVSKIGSSLEFALSCDLLIGMTSMALIEAIIMSCNVLSIQLNLNKKDVFFGTTRGCCPSVYTDKELSNWLQNWLIGQKNNLRKFEPRFNTMLYKSGASQHVITIMEEMIEKSSLSSQSSQVTETI
ncbi:MAG TPA: hypothetical protein VKL21_08735 [Candidatus Methanoperedens sp.]|nr:hypothetical protein [Candidatus Methanoperedens sp.]